MMSFFSRSRIKRYKNPRKKGYVLLVTFLVSALILTVGMTLAQILAREIHFSSDLWFAEKAYFAAESGVEKALIELKKNPVNWIEQETNLDFFPDESADFSLQTQNRVQQNTFTIPAQDTVQFRLRVDGNSSYVEEVSPVTDFDISPSSDKFRWKIQCQAENIVSLTGTGFSGERLLEDLWGSYDPGEGLVRVASAQDFFAALTEDQKKTCFMTFTAGQGNVSVELSSSGNVFFSPPIALIRSVGTSVTRQKIIEFDYRQKNLSPFFDFVFK